MNGCEETAIFLCRMMNAPPALTRVNWSYDIIFFSHPLGWSPSIFSLFQVKRQGKLFVYYQPLFECVWSAGWLMFPLHNQHKSVCGLWILSRTLKSFSFVNIVSSPMISISWLVAVRGFGSPDLTGPHWSPIPLYNICWHHPNVAASISYKFW